MNFVRTQREKRHSSFLMEYNSEANQSLWSGKDMDRVLTGGLNMNAAFSFTYYDLYLRRFKEVLKQTMLEHESVFEDQIHELHRLYWRQKELMVEMEGTRSHSQPRHPESLYPIAGFAQTLSQDFPRTCNRTSMPSMSSSISTSKTSILPQEEPSARIKAGISGTDCDKSGKKVLDLELPAYEYLDTGEERVSHDGEVHEAPDMLKEQSPRSISLESDFQLDKLHHFTDSSKLKCMLDLNEPAKVEEPFDIELNRFPNPVTDFLTTSNTMVEESNSRNGGGDPENGSHGMHEVLDQLLSIKCQSENGIDLNMSPLSSEENVPIPQKIELEQPQESFSYSLHEKHGLGRPNMVVQALPCSRGISPLHKHSKSLFRSSRPNKKGKRGLKNTGSAICPQRKKRKGSYLDSKLGVHEDDDCSPSTASYAPEIDLQAPVSPENKERTRRGGKSDNYQARGRKRNSSSLANVESVRNKEFCRTKKCGTKLENMRSSLATEVDNQERAAAEAIVDISSSGVQAGIETSTSTACSNLQWFALIASSVVEDSKSVFGLSASGCGSASSGIDYFEAMTLQLTEMKVEKHYSVRKTNSADHRAANSNVIPGKHRKSRVRQGKRQYKNLQHEVLPRLASFSPNEVSEDLQTIGRLMEATGTKWNKGCLTNKTKSGISTKGRRRLCNSPPKPTDAFTASCNCVEEKRVAVDWGTVTRGRRGPRIPAANFQLILSQV